VFGVDESLKARADALMSLSPLTFTHRMARLVLIEQIYRACMIRSGRKYHI
jgi:23S rRNA (pseudouridine1915-N3)-methyltransferase